MGREREAFERFICCDIEFEAERWCGHSRGSTAACARYFLHVQARNSNQSTAFFEKENEIQTARKKNHSQRSERG